MSEFEGTEQTTVVKLPGLSGHLGAETVIEVPLHSAINPVVGITDHGLLLGLDEPDHPISAIQNLQIELDNKANIIYADEKVTVARGMDPLSAPTRSGLLWINLE